MHARRKVAVILQLWQNFDRGILQGIASYVRERHDWAVFVEEVEHQRIPDFKAWDGDGLIVNFDNPHVVRALRGVNKPIVAVGGGGGCHDPASGIPYVATEDETIGRLAAEHLMDCGLRNFAFCGYPKNRTNVWMMNRKRGFSERLAKAGFTCHAFHGHHTTATHWQDLLSELSEWLCKLPLPIGIMGCYDYRARHLLEACKSLGLRVPDDVAVIGVDDDIVCELADPPLSSIEQGKFQIGYAAAKTLEQLMSNGGEIPLRQLIAPVGLVPRQSTNLLCVADEPLAVALRTIRERACQGLQAQEVAEQAGLSRNTLDKRCKALIGRSIDLEIRRVRLDCAKDLLARTALPLREVARRAGFGSEQYLSSVFSKTVGCRPSQYRIDHRDSRLHSPI
jgi:LacI family transcriptional regulator